MRHFLSALVGISLSVLLLAPVQSHPQESEVTFPVVVEATHSNASLFTLYDANSKTLRKLEAGELVIAHEEKAGWYRVEVPAGFGCWIYGDYFQEGEELGIGTVTDNRVNLRALPTSANNYPIGQVSKGQELKVLDQKNKWIQVIAPESVRPWVSAADFKIRGSVASMEKELATWRGKVNSLWEGRLQNLAKIKADQESEAKALVLLEQAEQSLAEERAKATAGDYGRVTKMFTEAAALATVPATKELIQSRIDYVDALARLAQEKLAAEEMERKKRALEEQAKDAATRLKAKAKERVRFQGSNRVVGRFDRSGWVKRKLAIDKGIIYVLQQGGVTLCELSCSTDRYDLGTFLDHEIGVRGVVSSADALGSTSRIDVTKIEILSVP